MAQNRRIKEKKKQKEVFYKGKKNQRCRQVAQLWNWERGITFYSLFLSRIYFVDTAKNIMKFPKTLGPPFSVLVKSLLMKVKVGLKLNIQKTKIVASGPITSWGIDGETVETVSDFIFWGLQNNCRW